jgi:aspartyl-tRNA(Asn)/glutamyl-tRNA(Gln) amidotransferase subunit C
VTPFTNVTRVTARLPGTRRSYNPPSMIDRNQVLHVAKLARLRLSDDEVERMSGELSTILDHIEKIGELDLKDVPPTSHVVHVENVFRKDEPRPCLPREKALEQAPDATDDGFRVPTPGAHA